MDEYPGNSRSVSPARAEPPERAKTIKLVVDNPDATVKQKQPLGRRLKETFFGGGETKGVFNYVVDNVLVPALGELVTDVVSETIHRALYGGNPNPTDRRYPSQNRGGFQRTPYNQFSSNPQQKRDDRRPSFAREADTRFDEIIVPTEREARGVIEQMCDVIDEYDFVTIADLYQMVGITVIHSTDNKWGWSNLSKAYYERVGNGYLLKLPPTRTRP